MVMVENENHAVDIKVMVRVENSPEKDFMGLNVNIVTFHIKNINYNTNGIIKMRKK